MTIPRNGTGFHINWKQNESLWEGSHYNCLLPAAQDECEATEAEQSGAGRLGDDANIVNYGIKSTAGYCVGKPEGRVARGGNLECLGVGCIG